VGLPVAWAARANMADMAPTPEAGASGEAAKASGPGPAPMGAPAVTGSSGRWVGPA